MPLPGRACIEVYQIDEIRDRVVLDRMRVAGTLYERNMRNLGMKRYEMPFE